MTVALWVTAILLTLANLAAGGFKALTPIEKLKAQMPWAADFSSAQVKMIGVVEIIGALGVILPLATGIAPILTPIAAICLIVVQILAITVHVRRKETTLAPNIVVVLLAAAVAVLFFFA